MQYEKGQENRTTGEAVGGGDKAWGGSSMGVPPWPNLHNPAKLIFWLKSEDPAKLIKPNRQSSSQY